jgi:DNA-binding CsgD family transcriptional regulator/tetratricopeptide (TPR) repeat protein
VAQHVLLVDAGGDYTFRHALVQEAVYDELLPAERPPLHAAYAAALAGVIQDRTDVAATAVELGQLAHHWYAAHDLGPALLASVDAGRAAEAAYALSEAQQHYERALTLWDKVPAAAAQSPLGRVALLQRAAEAASLVGDSERAIALVKRAIDATDSTTEPTRAGALWERLARYHWLSTDWPRAMQAAERAVAIIPADPPSRERVRVLTRHASALISLGREVEGRARCEEALALCRRLSTSATPEEAYALKCLAVAQGALGHLDVSTANFEKARRIADEMGFTEESCRLRLDLGSILMGAGLWVKASESSLECYRLAHTYGLAPTYGAAAGAEAARSLVFLGRWDEAEQLLDEVFDLDTLSGLIIQAFEARALLRLHRGDLVGARADLDAVLEGRTVPLEPQFSVPFYTQLADINIWEGRLEDARDSAADGLVLIKDVEDPDLIATTCLAGVAAEAAIIERDRTNRAGSEIDRGKEVAAALRERARSAASTEHVVQTPLVRATLTTIEAEWTRVMQGSDPERWAEAVRAWHELGCPYASTYASWRQSEALLGSGAARGTVVPILRSAWASASELGARLLAEETSALARRSRIELPSPLETQPAADMVDEDQDFGLTAREREVLVLLGDGRTNRQIGQALFISDKTVSVHVSHILAKLNAANRGEAAALARRLRLD